MSCLTWGITFWSGERHRSHYDRGGPSAGLIGAFSPRGIQHFPVFLHQWQNVFVWDHQGYYARLGALFTIYVLSIIDYPFIIVLLCLHYNIFISRYIGAYGLLYHFLTTLYAIDFYAPIGVWWHGSYTVAGLLILHRNTLKKCTSHTTSGLATKYYLTHIMYSRIKCKCIYCTGDMIATGAT